MEKDNKKCMICGKGPHPHEEYHKNIMSGLVFKGDDALSRGDFINCFNANGIKMKEDMKWICCGCKLSYWDACQEFKKKKYDIPLTPLEDEDEDEEK